MHLSLEIPEMEYTKPEPTPTNLTPSEITPSLYISSYKSAKNAQLLRNLGITHILNLSPGCQNLFTDEFTYCSLGIQDSPTQDISLLIVEALDFIEANIKLGGKILVHCLRGKSRAPTIACAYLMRQNKVPSECALKIVKKKQPHSNPNFGFISQLSEFEAAVS